MKFRFLILLVICPFLVFSQELPKVFPEFRVEFERADSIDYPPAYADFEARAMARGKSQNSYDRAVALEEYLLKSLDLSFLKKIGTDWQLTLKNGQSIRLSNERYSGTLTFEAYLASYEFVIFRLQYSEGNAYILVDRNKGINYLTLSAPVFSPGGRFFITFEDDILSGYNKNGFQLYEKQNGIYERIWEFDPKDMAPSRLMWLNDFTLAVELYTLGFPNMSLKYYQHYKMKIVSNR